jgi:hypothetical protein
MIGVHLRPDGRDPSVHHVRRGHDISTGLSLARGCAGQKLQAHVVHDTARILLHDAAMAVAHVLAQAHVRDYDQLRHRLLDRARCKLDDALGVIGSGRRLVLVRRHPE